MNMSTILDFVSIHFLGVCVCFICGALAFFAFGTKRRVGWTSITPRGTTQITDPTDPTKTITVPVDEPRQPFVGSIMAGIAAISLGIMLYQWLGRYEAAKAPVVRQWLNTAAQADRSFQVSFSPDGRGAFTLDAKKIAKSGPGITKIIESGQKVAQEGDPGRSVTAVTGMRFITDPTCSRFVSVDLTANGTGRDGRPITGMQIPVELKWNQQKSEDFARNLQTLFQRLALGTGNAAGVPDSGVDLPLPEIDPVVEPDAPAKAPDPSK